MRRSSRIRRRKLRRFFRTMGLRHSPAGISACMIASSRATNCPVNHSTGFRLAAREQLRPGFGFRTSALPSAGGLAAGGHRPKGRRRSDRQRASACRAVWGQPVHCHPRDRDPGRRGADPPAPGFGELRRPSAAAARPDLSVELHRSCRGAGPEGVASAAAFRPDRLERGPALSRRRRARRPRIVCALSTESRPPFIGR